MRGLFGLFKRKKKEEPNIEKLKKLTAWEGGIPKGPQPLLTRGVGLFF